MYKGVISVDFEGLDDAHSEFMRSIDRLSIFHRTAIQTVSILNNMRFNEKYTRSVEDIEKCAVKLKIILDETDDLARKLADIRNIYYETEIELTEFAERLPQILFEPPIISKTTYDYLGNNYTTPVADTLYRGNLIKNEEWLDDLVNDFIISRRRQL